MISFLSPLFLLGTLAAAVPIVLHLLRREPEPRVRFSAVKLLRHAPVEYTQRRRLRELLLLALRVAALVLLAVAFARPFSGVGAAGGATRATIIALDTSYSMSAAGTFARARQLARAAVANAPAGDLIGVVTFADGPRVAARPLADRALALSAIDAAAPGFGATRYRGALSAAVEALEDRPGTIVVVTDLQESGWDAGLNVSIPESDRIEIADVGLPPANLAVTAVRVDGDRITASLHNSSRMPRDTRAHLTLDGRPAGDATVAVGPGAAADVSFTGASRAATAMVSIDDAAGIQADNVRYLILDSQDRMDLLILTDSGVLDRDAFYLQQALSVDAANRRPYRLAGASPAQVSSWDAARLSTNAAIVLLSTRGLERRGRESLAAAVRSGVGLLIAAGPDVDGEVVGDILGGEARLRVVVRGDERPVARGFAPVDARHPIFRPFEAGAATLRLVTFRRVSHIEGSGCQSVARFTTGETALLECSTGEGRGLVFASDFDNKWNDFPLHASFVPFLHEMVRYLGSGRQHAVEYLVGDVPAGVPAAPGIVTLADATGSGTQRLVAVNVDSRESDPARISTEGFQKAFTRLKGAGALKARSALNQQEDRQQIWRYVMALVICVLAVEGMVASRTA